MDTSEKADSRRASRLKAVLFGLLFAAAWAIVLVLSVKAIIGVSGDLSAAHTAGSYAERSFTVSYDDRIFTSIGFVAEGAADEVVAREEVLSFLDGCVPLIVERVLACVAFYLLMLSPFLGAAVFHASAGGEEDFVPRFAAAMVAVLVVHVAVIVGTFIATGVPISFTRPAMILFLLVSYASVIAGSAMLCAILAKMRFAIPAVIAVPVVLYFVFSFDALFGAELFSALIDGLKPPVGAIIYEALVPHAGSALALTAQILAEEDFTVPILYAAPYAVKALVWFEIARAIDRWTRK